MMRSYCLKKYKKYAAYFLVAGILLIPNLSLALSVAGRCSPDGYTIATINGMLTNEDGAKDNMDALRKKIGPSLHNQEIDYQYLFNPSHLGGAGDAAKAVDQGIFDSRTVQDYDLENMLREASDRVHTQKLLLVAHSQGNFYANSFYDLMADKPGGVPAQSLGIYAVATPSSRVAGEGRWITSNTDKVIAGYVNFFKNIMEPNVNIILQSGDDSQGHDFKNVYLKYESPRIVSDIYASLDNLKNNDIQKTNESCIAVPNFTTSHKIKGEIFARVDPVAGMAIGALGAVAVGAYKTGSAFAGAIVNTASALGSVVNSIIKLPAGVSDSLTASNLAGPATLMPEQNNSAANPQSAILPPSVQKSSSAGIDADAGFASPFQTAPSAIVPQQINGPSVTVVSATPQAQNKPDSYHDYGGGADRASSAVLPPSASASTSSVINLEVGLPSDVTALASPVIVSPANFRETFTASTIIFQGTAEASSTISTDFDYATTTANATGNWQMAFNLPQGESVIKFFAIDDAGNQSSSTEIVLLVDSMPPNVPILSVDECVASLSEDGCLVATTTTLHLQWSGDISDINYYELSYDGIVSTTTETFQNLNLNDDTDYNFTLRARDYAGNWSESALASVVINTMPVVINEVAWAGTAASVNDEWIELYNRTPLAIALDKWTLRAEDGVPYINLSGNIEPKSYYLIERGDEDEAISDIEADLSVPFSGVGHGSGLEDNGEVLSLLYFPEAYATTTMDQTAVTGLGGWVGGDKNLRRSMERFSPDAEGDLASSWGTNNGLIRNGADFAGNIISGTPKARNSMNYLIAKGAPYVSSNVVLSEENSPYLVNNTLQVFQPGSALTIEPGVVIKFYNDAGLRINSSVDARGTADNPIVFTGFQDDEYGGDLNGDATSTSPSSGSWYGVRVNSGSNSAIFDYAIFRYGGKYYSGTGAPMANFYVKDTPVIISHSISEYSKVYGLQSVNSDIQMRDNIFRFNNKENDPAGINAGVYVSGGTPQIVSNTFSQNKRGLYLSSSPGIVSDNIFSSNASEAVYSAGLLPSFSNNQGSNNAVNGLIIAGIITPANSFSTTKLIANPWPYVITASSYSYPKVSASSTLSVEKGVVIKSQGQLQIEGRLVLEGENSADIVLTSVYDDSVGGDTTNNATSTLPAPGQWPGIYVYPGGSVNARGFTLRYAGSEAYGGNNSAGIVLNGAVANISNALFGSNYPSGISAANGSEVNIENVSFENHNKLGVWGSRAAFAFANSGVSLNGVVFTNNVLGIMGDLLSSVIASGVEFINNTATTSPANLF